MRKLRVVLCAGMCLFLLAGCQWGKPAAWSNQPRRSDDPLLCTDAERKRPRDLYATTSDSRFTSPIVVPQP